MSEAGDSNSAPATPYTLLGGEARVRALVERFYDLMDAEPDFAVIRRLHPPELANARNRLYWYLSGWLGGPNHYIERFGHPMLRARHLPFSIGIAERDAWLSCLARAMDETGVPEILRDSLASALFKTADWMRNRAD